MDNAPIVEAAVSAGVCFVVGVGASILSCCYPASQWTRILVGGLSLCAAAAGLVFTLQTRKLALVVESLPGQPGELLSDIERINECVDALRATSAYTEIKTVVNDYDLVSEDTSLLVDATVTTSMLFIAVVPAATMAIAVLLPGSCRTCCLATTAPLMAISAGALITFRLFLAFGCDERQNLPEEITFLTDKGSNQSILPPYLDQTTFNYILNQAGCTENADIAKWLYPGPLEAEYNTISNAGCDKMPVWSVVAAATALTALCATSIGVFERLSKRAEGFTLLKM